MYRWVDHTSEVELELHAPSERALFAAALDAFGELVADGAGGATEHRDLAISGADGALLLVGWLAGEPGSLERSFGSACHGAGRALSRTAARKKIGGAEMRRELEARGIVVRSPSNRALAEEAPFAYKDVEHVVEVVERAGLARRVAQVEPLGVVKG